VVIPRAEHSISRAQISPNALKVLYRLREAGFQAFLVGGAVRDLLLGIRPKDFDVATNALPDDVRRIFRNCRLIGRRFRLAHVHFGQEIIEVATFRAAAAPEREDADDLDVEADGAVGDRVAGEAGVEVSRVGSQADDGSIDSDELDDLDDPEDPDNLDETEDGGASGRVGLGDVELGEVELGEAGLGGVGSGGVELGEIGRDGGRAGAALGEVGREDGGRADAALGEVGRDDGGRADAALGSDPGRIDRSRGESSGRETRPAVPSAAARFQSEHRAFDTTGRILRDNIYGTIEEDVWRRDFAANGLYYNIEDFSIWDFVDGVSDVKARRLKLIGDPETRYREDPVRMLRAVRFAAKLDFSFEEHTERPIRELANLLDGVPAARLFDECLKLFLSGFGAKSFRLLRHYGLFEHLFPMSAAAFALSPYAYAEEMLELGLVSTDARIAADKPVTPTFLFAILLWGAVLRELNERAAGPAPDLAQLMRACDTVLRAQQSRVAIPRRFAVPMRELLMLQPRFNRRSGVKALSLLQHPRFRAAYDFLLLRAQAGVADPELARWWTDIQLLPHDERVALVQARPADPPSIASAGAGDGAVAAPGRRRRRRRRGGASRS
jgi:poly(A) polymerase